MAKLKMIIGADRPGYDHFTIRWEDEGGKVKGVEAKVRKGFEEAKNYILNF